MLLFSKMLLIHSSVYSAPGVTSHLQAAPGTAPEKFPENHPRVLECAFFFREILDNVSLTGKHSRLRSPE